MSLYHYDLLKELPSGSPPFVFHRWGQFNYSEPPFWVSESFPVPPVIKLVGGNFPFVPGRWRFDYNDASLWTVESLPVPPVQKLAGGGYPFKPPYWKHNYNDAPIWGGAPSPIPDSYMPVGGGFPFVPQRWKFNNDDYPVWTVESFSTAPVQKLVGGNYPFKPLRWKYDLDAPGYWSGSPSNVSLSLNSVAVTPLTPTRWKFSYDEIPSWSYLSPVGGYSVNQPTLNSIVDTMNMQLPVNCVLMGEQLYEKNLKTLELSDGKLRTKTTVGRGSGGRISGDAPSFVTRNSKGYD